MTMEEAVGWLADKVAKGGGRKAGGRKGTAKKVAVKKTAATTTKKVWRRKRRRRQEKNQRRKRIDFPNGSEIDSTERLVAKSPDWNRIACCSQGHALRWSRAFFGSTENESISPLHSGRLWSSFVASAGNESLVELRAIISERPAPEAERRREMHRLQLLSIVDHPGLRRIIDVVAEQVPPFIVLEPLAADGPHGCTIESCQRLFDALSCAHRHGFFAEGISLSDVRVRSAGDWLPIRPEERTKQDGKNTNRTGLAAGNSGAYADPAGTCFP